MRRPLWQFSTLVYSPITLTLMWSGAGIRSDDPGGYGDDFGHGTSVAGVLAAKDNSFGTVGIAPGAPIYSVKVLDSQDSGEDSNIICGINWMAAHSGIVRVANMSLVEQEDFRTDTYDCGRSNHDAVHYAICAATKKESSSWRPPATTP